MDKLKILKFIVAVLTFLIVFGMLSAIGMIYKKTRPQSVPQSNISLSQPRGTAIKDFKVVEGNIYFHLQKQGAEEKIIILNPQSPEQQTTISIN